jgi:Zn-dependent peptidase ImmA (M78 family)
MVMKLFLGAMKAPIECVGITFDELQKISPSKKQFCGLYVAEENKIYVATDYSEIPTIDILLHEIGHLLINELQLYKSEEHKADILAIRLKHILEQRRKIYVFTE